MSNVTHRRGSGIHHARSGAHSTLRGDYLVSHDTMRGKTYCREIAPAPKPFEEHSGRGDGRIGVETAFRPLAERQAAADQQHSPIPYPPK